MPRFRSGLIAMAAGALLAACGDDAPGPSVAHYRTADAQLTIEAAADDLIHFEFSASAAGRDREASIETSPMIARTDYPGPSHYADDGQGGITTAALALTIDHASLCITVADRRHTPPTVLTTLCPSGLTDAGPSFTLTQEATQHLYGLGEHFLTPGQPNGDLLTHTIAAGDEFGNALTSFSGGNTANARFPILYALGPVGQRQQYALFLDQQYAQSWDFSRNPWQVSTSGGALRGYVLAAPDPLALREQYLDLVGRSPVPPKKMFGLWVSEFGYDNWAELEDKLRTLRGNGFPVDGFVLDLQWFGGVFRRPSRIGALTFDSAKFPDPAGEIARLRDQEGVGVMLIEEPYVDVSQPIYADLAARGAFPLACEGCGPVDLATWWGHGSMLDWTSPAAGDYWHDVKRQPLIDLGVLGHWTDLGEPETFSPDARYAGFPALGLHSERDVHNLYNFDWAASIARGYRRHGTAARPFILSRSGTAGIQRFGAAMWSGDIGSNMRSLAAQLDVQMHMSFSGIDYFGSDVGGFFHAAPDGDPDELYTVWLADSALLDVPLRPHTENLCNCRETAPDRIGEPASNLDNVRLRYRLIPYLYSLAHRAYRFGEPVVAPLAVYYPDDLNLRTLGDEKLLGRDLLVAALSAYGQTQRDVYLPAGTWIDFHTQEWLDSSGEWLMSVSTRPDGNLRLPLYARAGAIIPQMYVDGQTMNALGRRLDGTVRDELIVRVYADEAPTRFTLYEDDGATVAYQRGAVRTTAISQQRVGELLRVTVEPAAGAYEGAPARRDTVVELVARGLPAGAASMVTLNARPLSQASDPSVFEHSAAAVWFAADGLIHLRSGPMDVHARKTFEVRVGSPSPPTAVLY